MFTFHKPISNYYLIIFPDYGNLKIIFLDYIVIEVTWRMALIIMTKNIINGKIHKSNFTT